MPNHRYQFKPTPQNLRKFVTGCLYRAGAAYRPKPQIPVPVLCASANPHALQYPDVESIMGEADIQPYVHDVSVFLIHRDPNGRLKGSNGRLKGSSFRVFFKRHKRLSFNSRSIARGDILIMRIAHRNQSSVVNMRRSDGKLGDFIVRSLGTSLREFQGPKRKVIRFQVMKMPFWV
ncbi:hypothetical protein B0H11DRAFT_1941247 [Mycena galericulata]|nr:hypothetical protein B0H11DRAFT_1941247 [Mycena galericulata]